MRFIFIFLFFIQVLNATSFTLQKEYEISYGIFGELGIATAKVVVDDSNQYTITMHAKTTGIAKFLSQNKQETYTSKGIFQNEKFIPDYFSKLVTNDKKYRLKEYSFDHINQKVTETKTTKQLNTIEKNSNEEKETQILEYYAPNDILSLFFNLKQFIINLPKGNEHTFFAVGANKDNGKVDVEVLEKQNLKVFINQKIFSSPRGELYITLDKDGLCDTAILKDVLLFGDIKAQSINQD